MFVTSKDLIRSNTIANPYSDEAAFGPVAPRHPDFGKPVGQDDPSKPDVMLVQLRKGQHIKARCIARKVRASTQADVAGLCEGARQVVPRVGGGL